MDDDNLLNNATRSRSRCIHPYSETKPEPNSEPAYPVHSNPQRHIPSSSREHVRMKSDLLQHNPVLPVSPQTPPTLSASQPSIKEAVLNLHSHVPSADKADAAHPREGLRDGNELADGACLIPPHSAQGAYSGQEHVQSSQNGHVPDMRHGMEVRRVDVVPSNAPQKHLALGIVRELEIPVQLPMGRTGKTERPRSTSSPEQIIHGSSGVNKSPVVKAE